MPVSVAARAVYAAMRSPAGKKAMKAAGAPIGRAAAKVFQASQRAKNAAPIVRKALGKKVVKAANTTATVAAVGARAAGRGAKRVGKKTADLGSVGVAGSVAKSKIKEAYKGVKSLPAAAKSFSQANKNAQPINRKKLGQKKFPNKKKRTA